jgi:hypothetical protein
MITIYCFISPRKMSNSHDVPNDTYGATQPFQLQRNILSASTPNLPSARNALSKSSGMSTSTEKLPRVPSAPAAAGAASSTHQQLQPNANGNYITTTNTSNQTVFEDSWYFPDVNRAEAGIE